MQGASFNIFVTKPGMPNPVFIMFSLPHGVVRPRGRYVPVLVEKSISDARFSD